MPLHTAKILNKSNNPSMQNSDFFFFFFLNAAPALQHHLAKAKVRYNGCAVIFVCVYK